MKTGVDGARFGPYLKQLRMQKRITLREFCRLADADPGNISRLERGKLRSPQDRGILERYARALGLVEGSNESYNFFDYAAADTGLVPRDIMEDEEVVEMLPAFFRTIRGQKPSEEEMRALVDKIRKS